MNVYKHIGKAKTTNVLAIGCFALLFSSCSKSGNRFANEDIKEDSIKSYTIIRFDKEVMTLDPNHVEEGMSKLLNEYGELFDTYLQKGVEVGPAYGVENPLVDSAKASVQNESQTSKCINKKTAAIIRDEILLNRGYQYFFQAEDSVFKDGLDNEMKDFSVAMARFKHFEPKEPIPSKLIAMFSCFGPQMAVGDHNELMVSLDYYIGSNYKPYEKVDGLYDYLIKNLDRKYLVRDLTLGWIYNCFPEDNANNNRLLDEMIYQGKLMYLLEACLPDKAQNELMGYSTDQWEWCEQNEAKMWNYIKEYNHLYTMNRLTMSKYIEPAAHTAFFPFDVSKPSTPESPGKTGIWLGWRIVNSYMKRHEKLTIAQLMSENDSQKILQESGYNPK